MKKYLMTVMAAVTLGGLFTGCSKDADINGGNNSAEFDVVQNYENAFVTRFGQPHENQTWGFGPAVAGTRANNPGTDVPYTSDAINANANEWADPTPGKTYGGWVVPDPLTPAQKELVMKYFQAVPNRTYEDPHYRHFFIQQVYKGHDNPPTTGNHELNTAAGGATYTSDNMNYLTVGHNEAHINDFNTGSCSTKSVGDNDYTVNDNKRHPDEISLMVNIDDTECFGYHNSGCSIQRNDKAGLVHWTTIRTWAKEQGLYTEDILNDNWDRSFMGFDFELYSQEDSYAKDNSGNKIYALINEVPGNALQYIWNGSKVVKRGTAPASTRKSVTRSGANSRNVTRSDGTSVNLWSGNEQKANNNYVTVTFSDEAKNLLVAGNYLGVDLSVEGTSNNWQIKFAGTWGTALSAGDISLSADTKNVEIQLTDADVSTLILQNLNIWSLTSSPINFTRIYISDYSQANGNGGGNNGDTGNTGNTGDNTGNTGDNTGNTGDNTGNTGNTDNTGDNTQNQEENYEYYGEDTYIIIDGKKIPYLNANMNMYSGDVRTLSDSDMKISKDGKECLNLPAFKALFDEGYLPVQSKDLRTWVKWQGGDGYYSDWIVTLTKAERITTTPPPSDPEGFVCRIIAEDLTVGENSDFDFNDVVFDVFQNGVLVIRAIGGELPLYIGSQDAGHEVHAVCGISLTGSGSASKMSNTGWGSTSSTSVAIDYQKELGRISMGRTYSSKAEAKSIPIYVTKKGENILLKADQGKVASKVCVGSDFEWCSEREDIDRKFRKKDYTKLFQQYVIGNLGDDWLDPENPAWYQLRGK